MTAFLHKEISSKLIEAGSEDFGLTDKQGRSIGVKTTIREVETRLRDEGEPGGYWRLDFAATIHYRTWVQATRNGQQYGSSQPGNPILTLELARRKIASGITNTRKRYTKKFARE